MCHSSELTPVPLVQPFVLFHSNKKGSHIGLPFRELCVLFFASGLVVPLGNRFSIPDIHNLNATVFLPPGVGVVVGNRVTFAFADRQEPVFLDPKGFF